MEEGLWGKKYDRREKFDTEKKKKQEKLKIIEVKIDT